MKKHLRARVLSFLVLLTVSAGGTQWAVGSTVSSWAALQDELSGYVDESGLIRASDLKRSSTIQTLVLAGGRQQVGWEMMRQGNAPLVVAAGYELIAEGSDDEKCEAAIYVVATKPKENSIILLSRAVEAIQVAKPTNANLDHISSSVKNSGDTDRNILFILELVSSEFLTEWWSGLSSKEIPASVEAAILSQLLTRSRNKPEAVRYAERLKQLGEIPGLSRAMWLLHAANDESVGQSLRTVLADESIDSLTVGLCVQRFRDQIKQMDLTKLQLSNDRHELINDILRQ